MREAFIEKRFRRDSLIIIGLAIDIIEEYQAMGFTLTLRQLYYQFVSKDLIPNNQKSYKRLGSIINDARLAGYIDWEAIEDRTRGLKRNLHLDGPKSAIELVRGQYGIDMWANQPTRVEVWIEKEALVGVIERVCSENDVPFFACKGYVSQSEQWRAYRRFQASQADDQDTIILHLGDHDPSGIDMTRDNQHRMNLFFNFDSLWPTDKVKVQRIALDMDQVEEYDPPPNYAKTTDSRFEDYAMLYGENSWELDALEPRVLEALIQENIDEIRDPALWAEKEEQLESELEVLDSIIENIED